MSRQTRLFLYFAFLIIVLLAVSITVSYLRTNPVRYIFLWSVPAGSPAPPPTGEWDIVPRNPHPPQSQAVCRPDESVAVLLVLDKFPGEDLYLSRFTFYSRTGKHEIEIPAGNNQGPYQPGEIITLGIPDPWPVPDTPGIYEFRAYLGSKIVASAVFTVQAGG